MILEYVSIISLYHCLLLQVLSVLLISLVQISSFPNCKNSSVFMVTCLHLASCFLTMPKIQVGVFILNDPNWLSNGTQSIKVTSCNEIIMYDFTWMGIIFVKLWIEIVLLSSSLFRCKLCLVIITYLLVLRLHKFFDATSMQCLCRLVPELHYVFNFLTILISFLVLLFS